MKCACSHSAFTPAKQVVSLGDYADYPGSNGLIPRMFFWLMIVFMGLSTKSANNLDILLWWLGGGVTPVLIPNTEVKLARGDGTSLYRLGE